eukprot:5941132-Lingulodinium_polyedra.AAC.2
MNHIDCTGRLTPRLWQIKPGIPKMRMPDTSTGANQTNDSKTKGTWRLADWLTGRSLERWIDGKINDGTMDRSTGWLTG